jgi:HAD superfamily hydrolase (TIGR01509 family)
MNQLRRPPALIIFDCDGVLVDSEFITNRVFCAMLGELGLEVSLDEMFETCVGRTMPYCYEVVTRMLGRPVPTHFDDELNRRTTVALKRELKPVAGVESVLDALDARAVPYCVASSGTHEKMRTTLSITGLWPRFAGKLYSVTEVAHAKPAPDVYLHAANRQGAPADRCYVVEDSPTGVRAGVAAGMTVFGYAGHTPPGRLLQSGAHQIIDEMRCLPTLWFNGHA